MVWTTPMTFTSGAVLTAAQLNTHLRDNLNETAPGKATTVGRFFTVTGVNQIAELDRPAASMNKIGGALRTANQFNDEGGWVHDTGSPTGGMTYGGGSSGFNIPADGIYDAHLSFAFDGNSTGDFRGSRLLRDSGAATVEIASSGTDMAGNDSSRLVFHARASRVQLAVGDVIRPQSFHNASVSLAPSSAQGAQKFSIEMVDPL